MNPSLISSLLLPFAHQALRSLQRYPLPLRSGKEAKILQHFGDRLCRMLDEKLKQHLASGGEHHGGVGGLLNFLGAVCVYFGFKLPPHNVVAVRPRASD